MGYLVESLLQQVQEDQLKLIQFLINQTKRNQIIKYSIKEITPMGVFQLELIQFFRNLMLAQK